MEMKKYFNYHTEIDDSEKLKQFLGVGGVAIGVFCGFIGMLLVQEYEGYFILIPIGVAMLIFGIVMWYTSSSNETKIYGMSGKQYDELIKKALETKKNNALNALGLDFDEVNEVDPIEIDGFKIVGASNLRIDDEDGILRTDLYELTKIFFTKNEMHIYKLNYDVLKQIFNESTQVYFYEDVVSISTVTETEKYKEKNYNYTSFAITTKGGTTFKNVTFDTPERQRSINAMRALLKEKKNR